MGSAGGPLALEGTSLQPPPSTGVKSIRPAEQWGSAARQISSPYKYHPLPTAFSHGGDLPVPQQPAIHARANPVSFRAGEGLCLSPSTWCAGGGRYVHPPPHGLCPEFPPNPWGWSGGPLGDPCSGLGLQVHACSGGGGGPGVHPHCTMQPNTPTQPHSYLQVLPAPGPAVTTSEPGTRPPRCQGNGMMARRGGAAPPSPPPPGITADRECHGSRRGGCKTGGDLPQGGDSPQSCTSLLWDPPALPGPVPPTHHHRSQGTQPPPSAPPPRDPPTPHTAPCRGHCSSTTCFFFIRAEGLRGFNAITSR